MRFYNQRWGTTCYDVIFNFTPRLRPPETSLKTRRPPPPRFRQTFRYANGANVLTDRHLVAARHLLELLVEAHVNPAGEGLEAAAVALLHQHRAPAVSERHAVRELLQRPRAPVQGPQDVERRGEVRRRHAD